MYSIDLNNIVPHKDLTCLVAKAFADENMLWHRRLGHLNFKIMNKLVRRNLVKGLVSKYFENDHTCVVCLKGKHHKASCKTKLVNFVSKPLHTLHMDLFGPTSDETSGILRNFISEIENLKELKVKLSRHQVTPKECHLHAVKRIFRYLKGHPKLRLWYPKESPFDLVAYSDSDYGGATQDMKSTTGGCQFLGRRLISWQCKKQTIVATSTTEAEYV
nr:putative ribonuclease H-like domain-containing protein [Tanacetum cinerariifolium]